ncbi:hypothetical protein GCM10009789_61990 [Kribbella sancticallisti]|uniref:Uncharacterized protein n=1 Tax=Kribbella sancticallisti TaxID=460087 RepID=A0ABN2E888_9ACTN
MAASGFAEDDVRPVPEEDEVPGGPVGIEVAEGSEADDAPEAVVAVVVGSGRGVRGEAAAGPPSPGSAPAWSLKWR